MNRLNIGCGPNPFPGWINVDRVPQDSYLHALATAGSTTGWPAWQARLASAAQERRVSCQVWDLRRGFKELFGNGCASAIYLGQMIEHLQPILEVPAFLHECYRMLEPGGAIRITTPNLDTLVSAYKEGELNLYESDQPAFFKGAQDADQLCYLMYGASGPESTHDNYEGHQHLYTPTTLALRLERAGFGKIRSWNGEAFQTEHPELFGDVVDQGMSYAFAMEAVKP